MQAFNTTQKLTTLYIFLKIRIQSLTTLWSIIKVLNICIFIMKLLQQRILNYAGQTSAQQYIRLFYYFIGGGGARVQVSVALTGLLILILAYLAIYFKFRFNLMNIGKKDLIVKLTLNYPVFVLIIVELLYCPIALYLFTCILSYFKYPTLLLPFIVSLTLSFVFFVVVTILNYHNRFLTLFAPIVLMVIQVTKSSPAMPILIGLFISFLAYKQKEVIDRCGYAIFLVICVYQIVDFIELSIYSSLVYQNWLAEFVNMGVAMIAGCAIVIVKHLSHFQIQNQRQVNKFMVDCIKQLDQNSPIHLSSSQLIRLESVFRNFLQNNSSNVNASVEQQQQELSDYQEEQQQSISASQAYQTEQSIQINQFINKPKKYNAGRRIKPVFRPSALSRSSSNVKQTLNRKNTYQQSLKSLFAYKTISKMEFKQLLMMFDAKLRITAEKNPQNSQSRKQYLMFRIYHKYKIEESIESISEFIDCQRYSVLQQKQHKSPSSQSQIPNLTSKPGAETQHNLTNYHLNFVERCHRKEVQFAIFEELLSKQPENEKVLYMIKMSKMQVDFNLSTIQVLGHMHAFWEKIGMDVLIEDEIEDDFYKLSQHLDNLKRVLSELQKCYKAEWETKILQMLIKLVEPYWTSKLDIQLRTADGEIKQDALLFFAVQNKNIVRVSPAFLRLLNCNSQQIIGSKVQKIMPEQINKMLKFQQNDGIKQGKQFNAIPILCGENEVHIYEASVKIQAEENAGIQFFYLLKKFQTDVPLAYLYISSIDLAIKYVNRQFYDMFNLSPTYVKSKISKKEIFLNNLVVNFSADSIIDQLVSKKAIKCRFSVKNLKSKDRRQKQPMYSRLTDKLTGYLTLQNTFGTDILASIHLTNLDDGITQTIGEKNNNLSKEQMQVWKSFSLKNGENTTSQQCISMGTISTHKNLNPEQKANSLCQNELNDQIYCLIPNPYKQKIQEKQSQLSESQQSRNNFINYSKCSVAMSLFIMLTFVGITIALIVYSIKQDNSITNIFVDARKVCSYPLTLIEATGEIYWRYLLCDNKQFFSKYFTGESNSFSVDDIVIDEIEHIKQILAGFYADFTQFYNRHIFANVNYNIVYTYYTIATDYSTTNLLEYSYNLKMASQLIRVQYETAKKNNTSFIQAQESMRNPLQFLMTNYLTISNIQAPFESMDQLVKIELSKLYTIKIIIFGACGIIFLIALSVSFPIKRNLKTIKQIFVIFSMINKKQIQDKYQQLSSSLQFYLTQVPKDIMKKLLELIKQNQDKMIIYRSKIRSYSTNKVIKGKEEEDKTAKTVITNKNNLSKQTFLSLKYFYSIILIFFVAVGAFLYKLELDLEEDKILITYFFQIQRLKYLELKNSVDMLHYNLLSTAFNQTVFAPNKVQNKKSTVNKNFSENFSNSFSQYFKQQTTLLKQDLCEIDVEQPYLGETIDCNSIGLGILTKGFIQSSQYLDYSTERLKSFSISLLQTGQLEKYPNILIHIYVRDKLLTQLNSYLSVLSSMRSQFSNKYKTNMLIFGVACLIIILAYGMYLFKLYSRISRIKILAVNYFKIIPKQTLERMDVSAYMNDIRLLDNISLL